MKASELKKDVIYYVEGIQLQEEADVFKGKDDLLRKIYVVEVISPIIEVATVERYGGETFVLKENFEINVLAQREMTAKEGKI
jgi:hypothetical protein